MWFLSACVVARSVGRWSIGRVRHPSTHPTNPPTNAHPTPNHHARTHRLALLVRPRGHPREVENALRHPRQAAQPEQHPRHDAAAAAAASGPPPSAAAVHCVIRWGLEGRAAAFSFVRRWDRPRLPPVPVWGGCAGAGWISVKAGVVRVYAMAIIMMHGSSSCDLFGGRDGRPKSNPRTALGRTPPPLHAPPPRSWFGLVGGWSHSHSRGGSVVVPKCSKQEAQSDLRNLAKGRRERGGGVFPLIHHLASCPDPSSSQAAAATAVTARQHTKRHACRSIDSDQSHSIARFPPVGWGRCGPAGCSRIHDESDDDDGPRCCVVAFWTDPSDLPTHPHADQNRPRPPLLGV